MSNLTTEAGQTKQHKTPNNELVDAINQTFALFQLNYHNQYFKAFSNNQDLVHIKRLWLDALSRFTPHTLLLAAKKIVTQSEFLPTLKKMIDACEAVSQPDLPNLRQAFMEACQAPSPKVEVKWSHPLVYHAGKLTDWYFLASNPEQKTFPVFKQNFQSLIERQASGETFLLPKTKKLPKETHTPLEKFTNQANLKSLRKKIDL